MNLIDLTKKIHKAVVIIIAEVDLEVDDLVLVDMVEVDRNLGTLDLEKVEMAQLVEQGVDMALVTMRIEDRYKRTMEVHTGAILAVVETIITTVIINLLTLNQTNLLHLELATMTSTDSGSNSNKFG